MKTLFFHSFWVATDLIRCPGVLRKIFDPGREGAQGVHPGGGGGCIGCWIWSIRESKLQLWIYYQNLVCLPNLALVWSKFDPVWSIWLILCQLYCISQYSVALFHQNLKLGADFTFKMAITRWFRMPRNLRKLILRSDGWKQFNSA